MKKISALSLIKQFKLHYYVCFIVGLLLRIRPAITHSLWLDEVFSFDLSRLSFSDLVLQGGEYWDFAHPSLFYLLIKFVSLISMNSFILRSISLLAYLLTYSVLIRFTKSLGEKYLTPICVALYCFHPYLINIQHQLRMYSLIVLFAVLLLYCTQMMNHTKKLKWAFFSALTLSVGFYIDYAMVWIGVSILLTWFMLVLTKNSLVKIWSMFIFLSGLLILPQLLVMIFHFRDAINLQTHIINFDLNSTLLSSTYFTGILDMNFSPILLAVISWVIIIGSLLSIYFLIKKSKYKTTLFLISSLVVGLFLSSVYSLIFTPIFQPRNLAIIILFPILGMSLFVSQFLQSESQIKRFIGAAVFLVVAFFNFKASYLGYGLDRTIDWKQVSNQVAKGTVPIFIGEHYYKMTPLTSYYLPQSTENLILIKNISELNTLALDQQNVFIFQEYVPMSDTEEINTRLPFCTKNACQLFFL